MRPPISIAISPPRTYSASSYECTCRPSQPPGANAPTASSVWTAPCAGPTMTCRDRPLEVALDGPGVAANDQSTWATWWMGTGSPRRARIPTIVPSLGLP